MMPFLIDCSQREELAAVLCSILPESAYGAPLDRTDC